MNWITIDGPGLDCQGLIIVDTLVAVGHADSAAMRRLLSSLPLTQIISLTGGRKRQTILVLNTGQVIITPLPLTVIERKLLEVQLLQRS